VFENSCEYIIKQKNEGKTLAVKITVILAYTVFFLSFLFLIFFTSPADIFIPLIFALAVVTSILILTTWRFTCVEFEVIITGGELRITKIYGKKFCKHQLNVSVNAIGEIGEYDDRAYEAVSKLSLQKNYICLSSLSAPEVYYALFDEDKDHCILYFDAPQRAIELLRKQNSTAFREAEKRIR
jgi:hypothetical protein